jgi:putative ABC transport system permease protein
VTAQFFPVLGVKPEVGRTFQDDEDREGGGHVVILGDRLWRQRFGGLRSVLGRRLDLNGQSYTVVGVMPPGFAFPSNDTDLWVPLALTRAQLTNHGNHYLQVIARLKTNSSIGQASIEMKTIAKRLALQYPASNSEVGAVVVPMREQEVGEVRPALIVLLTAVGLVLLVACANVANIILARCVSRQKEVAVRTALGASVWRLVRQQLTENAVLAGAGGLVGLLIAYWGLDLLLSLAPRELWLGGINTPIAITGKVDGTVLAFTAALSLGTGLLFGLASALMALRMAPGATLKDGVRGTPGVRQNRLGSALVISEVALAVMLLVGAGLLVHSFIQLLGVNPGFDPGRLLTVKLTVPTAKYSTNEKRAAAYREILRHVEAVPGVQSAGLINWLPMTLKGGSSSFHIEGTPVPGPGQVPLANNRVISAGYLRTMRIPLRAGREFDQRDTAKSLPVAIVNESMARQYFPGGQAEGKRFKLGRADSSTPWITVVGVAGDVRQYALDTEPNAEMMFPYEQNGFPVLRDLVMRSASADPKVLAAAVRQAIRSFDRDEPVDPVSSMKEVIGETVVLQRLEMFLMAVFSLMALTLASVGIYGVLSYLVAQRTGEIGIRMALGATQSSVLRLVVGRGLALAGIGIAVGLAGAAALTRLITGLLYGVKATDPVTFAAVPLVLAVSVILASYVPARRATRLDPVAALRCE